MLAHAAEVSKMGEEGLSDRDGDAAFLHGLSRKRRKLLNDNFTCSSTRNTDTEGNPPLPETHIHDHHAKLPSLFPLCRHETKSILLLAHTQADASCPHPGTLSANDSYHHLPHDLIISNIVASRLPLLDLIRARTVCRSWKDAIFSPNFSEDFVVNPDCRHPRLIVEHWSPLGPSLAVFDTRVNCWAVVPIPPFGRLVAASRGLFCFVTDASRPPLLVVGNPLTNQWKHLPAIPLRVPAHGPQLVAMVAKTEAGSYNVTVLFGMWNDDATDAYLPFIYDSVSGKWSSRKTISARLLFATSRSVVKPPDILVSVDSNAGNVLSYDMTNNVAYTIQLQHLPSLINGEDSKTNLWRRLPQIAVCGGMLYLVARCLAERSPKCKLGGQLPIVQHSSVGVWTMHNDSSDVWDFVTCIPPHLLETMVKGSDGTDFIIAGDGVDKLFFVLKGSPHMLEYHSSLCTWTLLPGCPADHNLCPLHQSAFYEPLVWVAAL